MSIIEDLTESIQVYSLIQSKISEVLDQSFEENCDKSKCEQKGHLKSIEKSSKIDNLFNVAIQIITIKPKLFDDTAQNKLVEFFKKPGMETNKFISLDTLSTLDKSKMSTLTWIKYEMLLKTLIKEKVYEPKEMARAILHLSKTEIDPNLAAKFASAISGCVKYCRESSGQNMDEEEEEKWCEIIDWMSWFMGGEQEEF